MTLRRTELVSLICLVSIASTFTWAGQAVNESARDIPVAFDVDLVVVGGSTGAVAAAIAAAESGAQVFLAAPYPYLGEDMTATLRLWLEPDEVARHPLARRIFDDELVAQNDPNRLSFTYQADSPSAALHRDTTPPSKLADGNWSSASQQSVQYDRDTNIIADLGSIQEIERVRMMFYRRRETSDSGTGFDVERIVLSVSDDNRTWRSAGSVENDKRLNDVASLSMRLDLKARFVRFSAKIPEPYQRMLLGEIEIIGPDQDRGKDAAPTTPPPRPMHVKKVLDDALLKAGVKFLYSCLPTDVLHDSQGNLCGIVMANRAGRQAVLAKSVIDATAHATVARLAGAQLRGRPSKQRSFRRIVIGGEPKVVEGMPYRTPAPPYKGLYPSGTIAAGGVYPVIEYSLNLELKEDSYASLMTADQHARTMTFEPDQQYTSDALFEVPQTAVKSRVVGDRTEPDLIPIEAFQPLGVERLFLLNGYVDVARSEIEQLLRPAALIECGHRLGKQAADDSRSIHAAADVRLSGEPAQQPAAAGDVREFLEGIRVVGNYQTIPQTTRSIPVLGTYDVVVIGGGTGGAPAGIGAARQGAKTLVIEYLHGLGGVGTEGAISSYYWGNRVGFTATVLDGAAQWKVEPKKEWFRQELLNAGADIWFGTIGCGAFVEGNRVVGAVVVTPYGRGVVLANTVIDATGNSDVAAAAGAECSYTDASEFGMQGTGLPGRKLGGSYNNTDFTIVDETDMVDVWHTFVYAKDKYSEAFDQGRLIDTRERRRIVGDATITIVDQVNQRTYPDTVVRSWSNFDTHGYTVDPYFLLEHPEKDGIAVYTPFRAMLPRGLEGIIVTGLSISAHRDAVPLIRMQADIQNGGYSAGVAGAMASYAETTVRKIDVRRLQEHLVNIANLPESILEDEDSYPYSDEKLADAVASLKNGHGAAVILTDPQRALPLLRQAFAQANVDNQMVYARVLATLGSDEGVDLLIEKVRNASKWDKGWDYVGMGQFGAALSELDVLLVALGRAGNSVALPAILEKIELLDARAAFSHHRSVGLATELLKDPAAAEPLASLLAKTKMTGHVHKNVEIAKERGVSGGTNAERTRRESLRELMIARALYRCGDHQGIGERILREYTLDLRGHFARHAQAVLDAGR